jgi:hypothetical protein
VNARSIDQHYLTAQFLVLGYVNDSQYPVAGGLRFGTDYGQLFSDESVEERGFTGIGTAQNANESGVKGHKDIVTLASCPQ